MRMAATLSHGRKQATGPGQSGSELGGGRAGLSAAKPTIPGIPGKLVGLGEAGRGSWFSHPFGHVAWDPFSFLHKVPAPWQP